MKQAIKKVEKDLKVKFSGGVIVLGSGTVPTSSASVTQTDIKKVISVSRAVSRAGIFISEEDDYEHASQAPAR